MRKKELIRQNERKEELIEMLEDQIGNLKANLEEIRKAQDEGCEMGLHCKGCTYYFNYEEYLRRGVRMVEGCSFRAGKCKHFVKRNDINETKINI